MAKLLGPDFISLQVRDLAASRTFYEKMLGFTVDERFTAPDFVLYDTNSIPFALRQVNVNLDESPQPGLGVILWIDCDSVDELYVRLAAGGTMIVRPLFDSPFGRALVFADPDGYRITANENPWDRFPLGGGSRS